jgi:hypothetical protein
MKPDEERTMLEKKGQVGLGERLARLNRIYEEIAEKNAEAHEILRSIAAREEPATLREELSGALAVAYTAGPPRTLSMELPARLMTLKELRVLNQRSWESRFEQYILARDAWENMIACAVEKGQKAGLWQRQFARAVVVITVFERPGRKHDVDNFSINFLHNALVRTGVLADDNFLALKYLVRGAYLPHKHSQEKTGVTVIDEAGGNIYCQNCKLCELLA